MHPTWTLEVFYDGACPLCAREAALLRKRDKRGRLRFTDIAAEAFDPEAYGKPREVFDARIQGRLPDGSWIEGVEVFRVIYTALGFGWLVAPSRLPVIRNVLNFLYDLFARNRHRLTGRCDAEGCSI